MHVEERAKLDEVRERGEGGGAALRGSRESSGRERRSRVEGRGQSQWRERQEEWGSCVAGCDTLAAIYETLDGKASVHTTTCEEVIGLPGDGFVGK